MNRATQVADAILLGAMFLVGAGMCLAVLVMFSAGCGSRQRITNTVVVHDTLTVRDTVCVRPPKWGK